MVNKKVQQLYQELSQVVIGQEKMIHRLLIGLFANGHVLLEGVPGLAKTLTISTLARALNLEFSRIQFTPDLLPADLIGTMIYNQGRSEFEVKQGPVFANMILADEINRSPAKVQSALLEAMQERQVTIGEETFPLPSPFIVLATQNPIDQEGTYPLPEAQIDRFMMRVFVSYPSKEEEKEIMRRMARTSTDYQVKPIMSTRDILEIRSQI
ncbi:MAG: AAA family ATPase, partial [Bacteroidota bacterium]